MDRKKISSVLKIQTWFVGFGFAFNRYLENRNNKSVVKLDKELVNDLNNIKVVDDKSEGIYFSLFKDKYENDSILDNLELLKRIGGGDNRWIEWWNDIISRNMNISIESIEEINFDELVFNNSSLNPNEINDMREILRSLHNLVSGDRSNFLVDLVDFMSISELLNSSHKVLVFKCNAIEYLYGINGLIDNNFYRFLVDLVKVVGLDLSRLENQEDFYNFIQFYERLMGSNLDVDSDFLNSLLREYYHPISDGTTVVSDGGGSLSDYTATSWRDIFRRNNFERDSNVSGSSVDNNNSMIVNREVNSEVDMSSLNESIENINIQDWLSRGDIYESNIGSFLYELYQYIKKLIYEECHNINIDYFYSYINNPELPFIKIVSIIILFFTTFTLLGWFDIIRYFIGVWMVEYFKVKEKYPFIYKLFQKSRKINYYILVFEVILMVISYIFIYFICIDILIN